MEGGWVGSFSSSEWSAEKETSDVGRWDGGGMNKLTGPTCFRCDDRGEGHWLREEQPGGRCPDSVIGGQVCGGACRGRGRGSANVTQREREAILRERLKEMAGEKEKKKERADDSC